MFFKKTNKEAIKAHQRLFKFFIALFIFLIPWQTRFIFYDWRLGDQVWQYGRLSIYFSMTFLLVAGVFFILAHKKELRFSKNKFLYLIFGFSILASFFAAQPLVSFYYLAMIYMAVLFAYLVKFLPKHFIFRAFLFSGLIQGLIALQQFLAQRIFANKWLGIAEHLPEIAGTSVVEVAGQRILRSYGALPHPNILGGFMFLVIFLGIYLWINFYQKCAKNNWKSSFLQKHLPEFIFILSTLVISTYGLLTSFSRSALLALFLGLLSVLLINTLRNNWLVVNVIIKYAVVFMLIFWSFNFWSPGTWSNRWHMEGRLEEQAIEERISTMEQLGFDSYKNMMIGQGLGMNTYLTFQKDLNRPVYNIQPIHNIFMLSLAELGIIGVLLLFNIIAMVFKAANKVDIMSTSLILGLAVIGMFDHYLWTSWVGVLMLAFAFINLFKQQEK
ncbi:hypothetical protein HOB10_04585 [Candidatus Parcubacteria bacterium]|jgi:hypothetical protein|nr:hypothetical protein [Candidatus Parcubacteria bacterium]